MAGEQPCFGIVRFLLGGVVIIAVIAAISFSGKSIIGESIAGGMALAAAVIIVVMTVCKDRREKQGARVAERGRHLSADNLSAVGDAFARRCPVEAFEAVKEAGGIVAAELSEATTP